MKKTGGFSEKICITATSQNRARRATVSFTMRRGAIYLIAAMLLIAVGACTYTALSALREAHALTEANTALQQKIEQQDGELAQYEQQIGDLDGGQP